MLDLLMRGHRWAVRIDHCELCSLALCVVDRSEQDQTICPDCADKVKLEPHPCPCCGRRWAHQFWCGWCGDWICDGCIYGDHELADCWNPDDEFDERNQRS